ncbi:hypothetical protein Q7C36_000870 [Tachysurus vachellii]|uniref:Transcription factor BTF3 n=3 Tax=Otophysi TaxID=186626 RepID=A0AA88TAW7_TACVA|nr:hypothetical protein Q7C36_000870 [Tachysurus vachellii]
MLDPKTKDIDQHLHDTYSDRASGQEQTLSCKADVSVASSVITMTVGIVSNTLALFILLKAYQRLRMKSNAYFLLFASGLVVTDFLGHLINGSLALYVYSLNKEWESFDPKQVLCGVFGICMSFFGLSPLLLGGIMAVERCIGVTRPLFHTTALTSYHIHRLLALTWILALLVALLPVLVWRPYQVQGSRSWCFYRLVGLHDWLDMLLPMIFSMLGLLALLISFVYKMNQEKLAKLQAQVRIGGKGTARRKKKVVHRTATADDKKLQSSLKKLAVNNIAGIEEVNMIKDDGTVIHFNNPKVQASLSANTFAITGHAETKQLTEMLPGILSQLGADSLTSLRKLAEQFPRQVLENKAPKAEDIDEEDDDVPDLVENFDEASKNEAN